MIVSPMQHAPAIVISHACDFENSEKSTVVMALVRPMRTVIEAEDRESIRQGRNIRFLPLPANDDPEWEEGYVDLSRLTSVRRKLLPLNARVLSAADGLLRALYVAIVRSITRYDVAPGVLDTVVTKTLADAADPE